MEQTTKEKRDSLIKRAIKLQRDIAEFDRDVREFSGNMLAGIGSAEGDCKDALIEPNGEGVIYLDLRAGRLNRLNGDSKYKWQPKTEIWASESLRDDLRRLKVDAGRVKFIH